MYLMRQYATLEEEKETMNIYEKLQICRVELQKLNLKKSGKNEFAKFTYYELDDILPAINELFLKYKLHSKFDLSNETATLTIINIEKVEEFEEFTSPIADASLKGCTPIQSLGGVHTYMKRYLYLNALEIVESDFLLDPAVDKPTITLDETLVNECQRLNIELNNVAKYYKKNVEELTNDDLRKCIDQKQKALGGNK